MTDYTESTMNNIWIPQAEGAIRAFVSAAEDISDTDVLDFITAEDFDAEWVEAREYEFEQANRMIESWNKEKADELRADMTSAKSQFYAACTG